MRPPLSTVKKSTARLTRTAPRPAVLAKEVDRTAIDLEAVLSTLFGPGVNSEDRLEAFLAIMRRKPAGIFWPAFHETWPSCDDTWHGKRRLLRELSRRSLWEAPGTNYLPDAARGFF